MEGEAPIVIEYNIDETDWYYKGEGNANLVIALKNEQKVFRIRKQEESETKDKLDLKDRASLLYYERVIQPLFSSAYFQLPKLARINEAQVNKLNELLKNVRPKLRQKKIITAGFVTVFDDLTLLPKHLNDKLSKLGRNVEDNHGKVIHPVFCVELKPKQGWLAPPDKKYSKCAFCLNQYLKLSEKSILGFSEYCPLDLFSGEKSRMLHAINSVLCTPQNNIRIFQDGKLIFGDLLSMSIDDVMLNFQNKDNFSTLVFNMVTQNITGNYEDRLLDVTTNEVNTEINGIVPKRISTDSVIELNKLLADTKPCNFLSQSLPLNSILDKVLKVQKLDTFGADFVYNYYLFNQNITGDDVLMKEFPSVLDPIESYLLSTMAKDCSILIAFQRIDNLIFMDDTIPVAEDSLNNKYVFQVNIADVDAKPIKCIENHYKRDNRIVQAALKFLQEN